MFKKIFVYSLFFISADLIIKIIIYKNNFMNADVYIIGELVAFTPVFNEKISWLASKLNINMGFAVHLVIRFLILFCSIIIFTNVIKKHTINFTILIGTAFWFSGIVCAILDQIIFSTSLDYIRIKDIFIFDLKDMYLAIFELIVLLKCITFISIKENRLRLYKTSDKEFFKILAAYFKVGEKK